MEGWLSLHGPTDSAEEPRFVSPKTVEQQDIQALHRIRSLLMGERTAIANQIRGLLMEYGPSIPQGIHNIKKHLPNIISDDNAEISNLARRYLKDLYQQMLERTKKIDEYEQIIRSVFNQNKDCKKIAQIEGVGLLTATAIIACIGNAKIFKNGRHLSAYLGLVPRQHSSGNKQKLLGISKRGNVYIRTLLIQGAKSAVFAATKKKDPEDHRTKWIQSIQERCGNNKAAVALANKNARTIWAMLANDESYRKVA